MSRPRKHRKHSGTFVALLAVPLLLVGYVLSAGPASWLAHSSPYDAAYDVWDIAYFPAMFIAGSSRPTRQAFERYVGWWTWPNKHFWFDD